MSTLLEIKSSVLRQVQNRQSFHHKTTVATASDSAQEISEMTSAVRKDTEDDDFFERLKRVLKKESRLHSGQFEGVLNSSTPPPPETVRQSHAMEEMKPTKEEVEMLYEEALYTVVYRSGVVSSEHTANEDKLFEYLQKVFGVSVNEHEVILQRIRETKGPGYALKVTVVEAKNLLAKDSNGFSDPYCMLGILIGQQYAKEPEEKKERKFSFRRKKEKMEKWSSVKDALPAKYIQVTKVKNNTLNPVWNENFLFEIDNTSMDQLHLDIWDHDDDVSVAEACKKLNEVSGFKGMGRYFKQIVKSARANGTAGASEDNADDFLGCLNISVNEIPVGGLDKWFKLEPRSSSSRVQGDCHLILKLVITQRETLLCKRTSSLIMHEMLLRQLLQYEHRQREPDYYNWKGEVSKFAFTVISHHRTQTDLSPFQNAVVQWQTCSKLHQKWNMDYSYLLELLKHIEEQWDPAVLQREQEENLAESFNSFAEHCLLQLRKLREIFPVANSIAIGRLEFLLRCLSQIYSMQPFQSVCPFHNELHVEIATALKKGTLEWYEEMQIKERLKRKVADDVSVAMEEVNVKLEQEDCKLKPYIGELIFELHITLNEIKGFQECLPLKDNKSLTLSGFHELFKIPIHMLLRTLHEKTCERIQKAVQKDKLESVDSVSKYSSSAVDVTVCFSLMKELWLQLSWPDATEAFTFITQLVDDISRAAIQYSELIRRKVDKSHHSESGVMTEQLCTILNNVEHVRKFIGHILKDLDWKSLESVVVESCSPGHKRVPKALDVQWQGIDVDLQRQTKNTIAHLTDKMIGDIKKYIQHISLSPDSIQNDEAVSPLMKYLDDRLIILNDSLVKENLYRVLEDLWGLLLKLIIDALDSNRDVSVEFFGRFYYTLEALVGLFHAEGQGLPLETLWNRDYKVLEEELRLSKCTTNELIEHYYLDKQKWRSTDQSKYGRISVKCYYEASEQKLHVEVLHAADLIALDANGLSDPFVIIELCPHHVFPMVKSQRTQVKAKTLNPVYDELFHFSVTYKQCRRRAACILFTVMDHDWLSSNDFAGEAVMPMNLICGLNELEVSGGLKNVQPTVLKLTRPKANNVKSILKMLEGRMDKEAQEFVKRLKEMEKCMGSAD
ncbi:BAI1-associated protein 3 [Alligator sinensis]|uniref:BAI1-associated protein 3 n=1 Tax=Alligator sinensis TaxID=38654 RepID=A0A3Q0FUH8_ALLSI|nr:BAI1-associated protein 3 [Alligator sinensis]